MPGARGPGVGGKRREVAMATYYKDYILIRLCLLVRLQSIYHFFEALASPDPDPRVSQTRRNLSLDSWEGDRCSLGGQDGRSYRLITQRNGRVDFWIVYLYDDNDAASRYLS